MSIFITIKEINNKYWTRLITEAHRISFPLESSGNEPAYDWQVCPRTPDSRVHHVISGSCDWQCCGSDEYSIDLPKNLLAGRIAHEISLHYRQFLFDPREWLDQFAKDNALYDPLILTQEMPRRNSEPQPLRMTD